MYRLIVNIKMRKRIKPQLVSCSSDPRKQEILREIRKADLRLGLSKKVFFTVRIFGEEKKIEKQDIQFYKDAGFKVTTHEE